jgi:hypothetical protein
VRCVQTAAVRAELRHDADVVAREAFSSADAVEEWARLLRVRLEEKGWRPVALPMGPRSA